MDFARRYQISWLAGCRCAILRKCSAAIFNSSSLIKSLARNNSALPSLALPCSADSRGARAAVVISHLVTRDSQQRRS